MQFINNYVKIWLCVATMLAMVTASNAAPIWVEDFSGVTSSNGSTAAYSAASGAEPATPPSLWVPGTITYGYTGYGKATVTSGNPYLVAVSVQENAVGSESGFVFKNLTGESIDVPFMGLDAAIPDFVTLAGWTIGSVTAAQVSSLSFSYDYVTSGSVSIGVAVGALGHGADQVFSSLNSSTTPATAIFEFSSLSGAQLQALADGFNDPNAYGIATIKLNFGGTLDDNGIVAISNFALVPEPSAWLLMAFGGGLLASSLVISRKRLTHVREI